MRLCECFFPLDKTYSKTRKKQNSSRLEDCRDTHHQQSGIEEPVPYKHEEAELGQIFGGPGVVISPIRQTNDMH
jgi:hypothetical protein